MPGSRHLPLLASARGLIFPLRLTHYLVAHTPSPIFLSCLGVACERRRGLARAGALLETGPLTGDQYSRYGMP
jgi:hypothetical protein